MISKLKSLNFKQTLNLVDVLYYFKSLGIGKFIICHVYPWSSFFVINSKDSYVNSLP